MTTTLAHQIRLLSISTEDLRSFVAVDDRYDYTADETASRVRFQKLCQVELNRRMKAGGQ